MTERLERLNMLEGMSCADGPKWRKRLTLTGQYTNRVIKVQHIRECCKRCDSQPNRETKRTGLYKFQRSGALSGKVGLIARNSANKAAGTGPGEPSRPAVFLLFARLTDR